MTERTPDNNNNPGKKNAGNYVYCCDETHVCRTVAQCIRVLSALRLAVAILHAYKIIQTYSDVFVTMRVLLSSLSLLHSGRKFSHNRNINSKMHRWIVWWPGLACAMCHFRNTKPISSAKTFVLYIRFFGGGRTWLPSNAMYDLDCCLDEGGPDVKQKTHTNNTQNDRYRRKGCCAFHYIVQRVHIHIVCLCNALWINKYVLLPSKYVIRKWNKDGKKTVWAEYGSTYVMYMCLLEVAWDRRLFAEIIFYYFQVSDVVTVRINMCAMLWHWQCVWGTL